MLTLTECLSKLMQVISTPNQKAATVVKVLVKDCLLKNGIPHKSHYDESKVILANYVFI